ncbi:hypothetical protein BGAL_0130g00210 [Botrytis galanthina]|uniref:2EXR domain-containing protein n=1 Tax=Botrytis galanthina TaxID=278940 RepID=A0A4S8R0R7_9HELO|nr:hypothetical protein BGAL_0130g00210 [Botrytis galanthina]
MSANTTTSQHNGMEFPKDDDTADKKIQVNTTPPLPVRKHQCITGNTRTLHRFGEFPREIQIKIFKLALPDPRIVYLRLGLMSSEHEEESWTHISMDKIRTPGLLPLLETCRTSNASVYCGDGFTKIKIEPLDGHPGTIKKLDLGACHYIDFDVWSDKVLQYNYIRPSEDILVMHYDSLRFLHDRSKSLNLERVTHIALKLECFSVMTPWISDRMTSLLGDVYSRCPNLKRLSVIGSYNCVRELPSATRLLSIDKDLLKLDFRDKDERQVPSEEATHSYRELDRILRARCLFDWHLESYRKEIEEEGNRNAIEYWKKVEVVDVLCCWPDESQDESNFYIPEIRSYVRCNDDGFLATLPESTPDSLIKLRDNLKLVELGDEQ